VLATIVLGQLLSFQLRLSPSIQEFQVSASQRGNITQELQPNRGQIYDRDGVILAVNTFEYRVGISPALISSDRREAATQIAAILSLNDEEVYSRLQPDVNGVYTPFVPLAGPIDDATARRLEDLDINGLEIESIPLRAYPQGELTAQLVGFMNYAEQGFFGIEGKYDRLLAGASREFESRGDLLDISEVPEARDGQDLYLTIDRDIQFVVNQVLSEAISSEGACGGTIIVMNPRTGEILAMQTLTYVNNPGYCPPQEEEQDSYNPAISSQFEPGSIFKVVSASAALQADIPNLDLHWTYNNQGCFMAAGIQVCDWDRVAKGPKDFTSCIVDSLNTCTATWFMELGPSKVYPVLYEFGFGAPTGIDLEGEASGQVYEPGDSQWSEAMFLTNSFGQGIAVTPLQMLNAVNAIANDGLLMQPHIVKERRDGDRSYPTNPNPIARPISAEVANAVTEIMVQTVAPGTLDETAYMEGYAMAGKTGTAEQPIPGGYSTDASWASFIGFVPADDPFISALVVLDRPAAYWGSQTAAPVFKNLMERLVVLLEIPPDAVRLQLVNSGGRPFDRN
jgi:cell division protein FtsI (penicillin-binding protein 3)